MEENAVGASWESEIASNSSRPRARGSPSSFWRASLILEYATVKMPPFNDGWFWV